MKYMLMMHYAPVTGQDDKLCEPIHTWPPADFKAHIDFMHRLNQELQAAGELVAAEGLAGPDQARVVRARKGPPAITDGPFPEAKEFLAGFWIVDCASAARALEIATRVSAAPGPGGAPLSIPVEVRQVMSAPGDEGCAQS